MWHPTPFSGSMAPNFGFMAPKIWDIDTFIWPQRSRDTGATTPKSMLPILKGCLTPKYRAMDTSYRGVSRRSRAPLRVTSASKGSHGYLFGSLTPLEFPERSQVPFQGCRVPLCCDVMVPGSPLPLNDRCRASEKGIAIPRTVTSWCQAPQYH